MSVVQPCTLQCSLSHNFLHMQKLLTELCPNNFVLEQLTPTRSRKTFKGKCVWTAHYRANCNIAGMNQFSQSVKQFKKEIPYKAKVIAYGRYGGPTYGIFIQYGKENCNCILDFHNDLTPFHTELRNLDETQKGSQESHIILFLNRSEYDDVVNISSSEDESEDESEDRFFCVKYAIEAIKLGSTAIGIRTSEGVAIAVGKCNTGPLMESATIEKIIEVDKHTDLSADARTSIDRVRYECQSDGFVFGEMSVECCAQAVSSLAIQFGNSADNLFTGIDAGDPQLWHMDPLGTYIRYDAKAIGSGSERAQQNLQENCTPNMTIQEAVNLSLRTLKDVMEEKFSSKNAEVVIVTPQRLFQIYTNEEVQEIIDDLQ